jgi:hypothetical protein
MCKSEMGGRLTSHTFVFATDVALLYRAGQAAVGGSVIARASE